MADTLNMPPTTPLNGWNSASAPSTALKAESMSLEDVFLQLTEAPEETETTETKTNEQEAE